MICKSEMAKWNIKDTNFDRNIEKTENQLSGLDCAGKKSVSCLCLYEAYLYLAGVREESQRVKIARKCIQQLWKDAVLEYKNNNDTAWRWLGFNNGHVPKAILPHATLHFSNVYTSPLNAGLLKMAEATFTVFLRRKRGISFHS